MAPVYGTREEAGLEPLIVPPDDFEVTGILSADGQKLRDLRRASEKQLRNIRDQIMDGCDEAGVPTIWDGKTDRPKICVGRKIGSGDDVLLAVRHSGGAGTRAMWCADLTSGHQDGYNKPANQSTRDKDIDSKVDWFAKEMSFAFWKKDNVHLSMGLRNQENLQRAWIRNLIRVWGFMMPKEARIIIESGRSKQDAQQKQRQKGEGSVTKRSKKSKRSAATFVEDEGGDEDETDATGFSPANKQLAVNHGIRSMVHVWTEFCQSPKKFDLADAAVVKLIQDGYIKHVFPEENKERGIPPPIEILIKAKNWALSRKVPVDKTNTFLLWAERGVAGGKGVHELEDFPSLETVQASEAAEKKQRKLNRQVAKRGRVEDGEREDGDVAGIVEPAPKKSRYSQMYDIWS